MFSILIATALAEPAAETWSPLRVATECQGWSRVDACTVLPRIVADQEVLADVPRSEAQVVLYISANERANDDLVLLRLVSNGLDGAPESFELVQEVDSRLPVDEQLPLLEQALLRGLAPFIAVSVPEALEVSLSTPRHAEVVEQPTTPWGWGLWAGGWGSWTDSYRSLSVWDGVWVSRVTNESRLGLEIGHNYDIERQPSLDIDGSEVSLDTDAYSLFTKAKWAHNLNDRWTVGVYGRGAHDDPDGQYRGTARLHAGVERNWFPSDDPRGNRLALAYLVGGQADWYNHTNALGQTETFFPTHMLQTSASVRFDTVELWLDLGARAELLNPLRRYVLEAAGNVELTLGDHVDLWLSSGVTQQAIPGPAQVDGSDFEEVTRADYAQPLRVRGNVNLRFHWDATNSAQNNRFQTATSPAASDNL